MKNNNLKIILTGISVISANLLFSQCPINFPKAIDVCLEGATQAKNICFENSDGNLNLLFGGENLFSFNKNVIDNQGNDINKLVIHGANQPNQTFNTPNIPLPATEIFLMNLQVQGAQKLGRSEEIIGILILNF